MWLPAVFVLVHPGYIPAANAIDTRWASVSTRSQKIVSRTPS